MSAMQRRKGQSGEREVCTLIRDWLGIDAHRNWQEQSAGGGADILSIPGYAIEVKLASVAQTRLWWHQACEQAHKANMIPALVWRITGQGRGLNDLEKWRVRLPLSVVVRTPGISDEWCEMTLGTWFGIIRERMT